MDSSLRKKAINSLIWTSLDTIFVKLIPFIATLYIARIISPSDFGLLASISIFYQISILLLDSGLSSSLIKTNDLTEEDFSTLFFFNVFTGFFFFLVSYVIAPFIAAYYNEPKLNDVIVAYGVIIVFVSFSSVQNAMYCKELRFKRLTVINFIAILISSVLGVIVAMQGGKHWSILLMQLANQLFFTLLIWFDSQWKPKFRFNPAKLRHHLDFGYKLMISGFINVFYKEIYKVIIAKKYSMSTVGLYDRARTLNEYPNSIFSSVITKAMYPIFVKFLDTKSSVEKAKNAFKQIIKINFLIFIPFSFLLASFSKEIITLLLGSGWLSAIDFFKILCFASAFYTSHTISVNIIKSFGRSDWFLKLEVIKKVIFTLLIVLGFYFGIKGLLMSIVLSSIIELIINSFYINKLIGYTYKELLLDVLPITLFSMGLYVAVDFFKQLKMGSFGKLTLILLFVAFALLIFNKATNSILYVKAKQIIKQYQTKILR